jgi:hypothetical protein
LTRWLSGILADAAASAATHTWLIDAAAAGLCAPGLCDADRTRLQEVIRTLSDGTGLTAYALVAMHTAGVAEPEQALGADSTGTLYNIIDWERLDKANPQLADQARRTIRERSSD